MAPAPKVSLDIGRAHGALTRPRSPRSAADARAAGAVLLGGVVGLTAQRNSVSGLRGGTSQSRSRRPSSLRVPSVSGPAAKYVASAGITSRPRRSPVRPSKNSSDRSGTRVSSRAIPVHLARRGPKGNFGL